MIFVVVLLGVLGASSDLALCGKFSHSIFSFYERAIFLVERDIVQLSQITMVNMNPLVNMDMK